MKLIINYSHVITCQQEASGKDGGNKAINRNSISQPLIGEDVSMLWQIIASAKLCMDL